MKAIGLQPQRAGSSGQVEEVGQMQPNTHFFQPESFLRLRTMDDLTPRQLRTLRVEICRSSTLSKKIVVN